MVLASEKVLDAARETQIIEHAKPIGIDASALSWVSRQRQGPTT